MRRGDIEEDLRHALRSARAAGHDIEIVPARCKSCDFVFSEDKLSKPGRCPACEGPRLFDPMIRFRLLIHRPPRLDGSLRLATETRRHREKILLCVSRS